MFLNIVAGVASVAAGLRACHAILYFGLRNHVRDDAKGQLDLRDLPHHSVDEVLFFPDYDYPCVTMSHLNSQHLCRNPTCKRLHGRPNEPPSSMLKFICHIKKATKSVDLCIFAFTQATLATLLLDLHRAGIKIRIITDASEDQFSESQLHRMTDAGIEVKINKKGTGALMHHKFVVVDNRLLLSGSFNWTNKAVVSNYEAVLVSSNPRIVSPFVSEFDKLWQKFSFYSSGSLSKNNWRHRTPAKSDRVSS